VTASSVFFIIPDKQCQEVINDLVKRVEGQAVPLGASLQSFFILPDKQCQEVFYDLLTRVEGQAVPLCGSLQCFYHS
jgi:hypothetical protein